MAQATKILICGDVEGNFEQLFNRVGTVHKKNGPFDMLICVGEFFGKMEDWQKVIDNEIKSPIPTYVLGPCKAEYVNYYPEKQGSDLANNITYLGQQGVFKTGSGIRIAYIGRLEGTNNESNMTHFNKKDIESFVTPIINEAGFKGVDILLTSQWPFGVTKFAGQPGRDYTDEGSKMLSQVAISLRPRYQFSGLQNVHYERLPYRNHQVLLQKSTHVTRFIALAKVGNPEKKKWIYAFSLKAMSVLEHSVLAAQPTDATECPYTVDMLIKPSEKGSEESSSQFFYDLNASSDDHRQGRKRPHSKERGGQSSAKKFSQDSCWFCLASPNVEKHLVISIGENVYLTLAKGCLVSDHVLILPVGHFQSIVSSPKEVLEEISKYKQALLKYFKSRGKTTVFFERNYKTSHLQIQVVPLPESCQSRIKETFLTSADDQGIELNEIPRHTDIQQIIQPGSPYFLLELATGEKLLHRIKKNFPLQFGREVVAGRSLLNMIQRADWKNCPYDRNQEEKMVASFRKGFESFDFTL